MEESFRFLNLDGLDDGQVRHLIDLLHPSNLNFEIEFPWNDFSQEENFSSKGGASSLNVHAPVFESYVPAGDCHPLSIEPKKSAVIYHNGSNLQETIPLTVSASYSSPITEKAKTPLSGLPSFNGQPHNPVAFTQCITYSQRTKTFNGNFCSNAYSPHVPAPVSTFKLNPTVSDFVPQSIQICPQSEQSTYELQQMQTDRIVDSAESYSAHESGETLQVQSVSIDNCVEKMTQNGMKPTTEDSIELIPVTSKADVAGINLNVSNENGVASKSSRRSWADIVSAGQKPASKVAPPKPVNENKKPVKSSNKEEETEYLSIEEDKMGLVLGKHLYESRLNFKPVLLQPRGLINRRNWCYVNATLQALLGCTPFYTLVRNLPLGPGVERGKSSTPVIDSMVKLTYEFLQIDSSQEELQLGSPFQPDFIYDMLRDLKSDCLKGQQEDAEEFLSFILNGMHEEMVKVIKNYEKKNHLYVEDETKENGDLSDGEEEWQVIGSKHRGMITRKVAEHKTPISDLLGGQIKSFLTANGNRMSASIQPFFTLQLDIQSENVNSVSEALKEMTVKEPIQGYTCAKTKQEVEAFSHVALQKLPPILILHLKRFVYNKTFTKTGGCKKVMKKTDYPLMLEISRDMFSPDVKKSQRLRVYKLFAVMYHDGEEAVKGHYISDIYSHSSQTWIRCDDRAVTAVSEDQVLSYSPPKVPYLLFYQEES